MSDPEKLADAMAETEIFRELDRDTRLMIAKEMRPVAFKSGQSIFSRGDPGRDMYFIVDGRVRLSILSAEGRELAFAHAGSGAVFGEIAMIDGKARTADATAVAKTNAMSLGHNAMSRLLERSPESGRGVVASSCVRGFERRICNSKAWRCTASRCVAPLLVFSPLTLTWRQTCKGARLPGRWALRRRAILRRSTL